MKRALVFAMVLCLVQFASAGLIWTSSTGSFDVAAGDVITFTLTATAGSGSSLGIAIDAISDNGAGGTMQSWTLNAGYDNPDVRMAGISGADFSDLLGTPGAYGAGDIAFIQGVTTGGVTSNFFAFTYKVSDTASGIINITGLGIADLTGGAIVALGGVNVEVPAIALFVPEPITVALLGLGGLFLRRRK